MNILKPVNRAFDFVGLSKERLQFFQHCKEKQLSDNASIEISRKQKTAECNGEEKQGQASRSSLLHN